MTRFTLSTISSTYVKSRLQFPWATIARLILLDFANYLIYYTRKKVTYELVTHEYNKLEVGE